MAREVIQLWTFGSPTLSTGGISRAGWIRGSTSPLDQKGATGWLAELYGGVQTGNDFARVNIPVNEMGVPSFNEAYWSWYQTNTESMGLGIVIWIHDPRDYDKRAEVTQVGGVAGLDKSSGWNSHEFNPNTTQMFFYGENTTGTDLTAGTQYTWKQFRDDTLFSTWTIYRITFDWGWEASGTFESAYLSDVKLNNKVILLQPDGSTHKKTVVTTKTLLADTAYDAGDVMSEATASATDWDFDFGGTGYIVKAVLVSATTGLTARVVAFLYSSPPTCELDDHAASLQPNAADLPYFLGPIDFPALTDIGSGASYTIATVGTYGNLPIAFDSPIIYADLVTLDSQDFLDDTILSLALTADMEDN